MRTLRGLSPADLLERFRATTAERREALSSMGRRDGRADHDACRAGRLRPFHAGADLDCWMHEHDVRVRGRSVG